MSTDTDLDDYEETLRDLRTKLAAGREHRLDEFLKLQRDLIERVRSGKLTRAEAFKISDEYVAKWAARFRPKH